MPDIFIAPSPKVEAETPRCHPLSAYMYKPREIHFQTQTEGETIILLLRRHCVTNIPWIVVGIILVVFPLVLIQILLRFPNINQIPLVLTGTLIVMWYLFTFTYMFVSFLLWYFTVSIVTEERIIDIDFINILNKRFSETRIGRVEDVTEHMGGFLRAFFNYGDVLVQTAGTHEEFEFDGVPYPSDVVKIINELVGKEEEEGETE